MGSNWLASVLIFPSGILQLTLTLLTPLRYLLALLSACLIEDYSCWINSAVGEGPPLGTSLLIFSEVVTRIPITSPGSITFLTGFWFEILVFKLVVALPVILWVYSRCYLIYLSSILFLYIDIIRLCLRSASSNTGFNGAGGGAWLIIIE